MSMYNDNMVTRICGEDIPAYRCVSLDGETVFLADGTKPVYGVATEAGVKVFDGDLPTAIRIHTAQSVVPIETDDDFAEVGATVFAAADGKVSASGSVPVGIVEQASNSNRGVKTVRVNFAHSATANQAS